MLDRPPAPNKTRAERSRPEMAAKRSPRPFRRVGRRGKTPIQPVPSPPGEQLDRRGGGDPRRRHRRGGLERRRADLATATHTDRRDAHRRARGGCESRHRRHRRGRGRESGPEAGLFDREADTSEFARVAVEAPPAVETKPEDFKPADASGATAEDEAEEAPRSSTQEWQVDEGEAEPAETSPEKPQSFVPSAKLAESTTKPEPPPPPPKQPEAFVPTGMSPAEPAGARRPAADEEARPEARLRGHRGANPGRVRRCRSGGRGAGDRRDRRAGGGPGEGEARGRGARRVTREAAERAHCSRRGPRGQAERGRTPRERGRGARRSRTGRGE